MAERPYGAAMAASLRQAFPVNADETGQQLGQRHTYAWRNGRIVNSLYRRPGLEGNASISPPSGFARAPRAGRPSGFTAPPWRCRRP